MTGAGLAAPLWDVHDGQGMRQPAEPALLPRLMETCTRRGFRIVQVKVERLPGRTDDAARVLLGLEGAQDPTGPAWELFQDEGVLDVAVSAAAEDA
ncbi:hypothetical protein ACWCQS_13655 [Streptomyces sp. NPDC002076]